MFWCLLRNRRPGIAFDYTLFNSLLIGVVRAWEPHTKCKYQRSVRLVIHQTLSVNRPAVMQTFFPMHSRASYAVLSNLMKAPTPPRSVLPYPDVPQPAEHGDTTFATAYGPFTQLPQHIWPSSHTVTKAEPYNGSVQIHLYALEERRSELI